ncbi:hypothetical protein, partial [Mesorhizobium sp. M1378]|uniref:hypothetical protein n=1 Tax=Mesorhizobium sp. M1378 TaxID=2957092 RepID=UPI00333ABCF3
MIFWFGIATGPRPSGERSFSRHCFMIRAGLGGSGGGNAHPNSAVVTVRRRRKCNGSAAPAVPAFALASPAARIALLARPVSVIVNHQITHDQHGMEPVSDSAGFGVVLAFGLLV